MKKIIYIITSFLLVLSINSCQEDDTTEGVSRITYFPDMTVIGNTTEFVEINSTYTDQGCIALSGEEELEVITKTSKGVFEGGDFNTNEWDLYTVSYSALNEDGYPGVATRDLWVGTTGDMTTDISGYYKSSVSRVDPANSYEDLEYVFIIKTGANTYSLSDGIGGYYDMGVGYRIYGDFRAEGGIITVNDIATNDFTITSTVVPYWGDEYSIENFTVIPETKTITYTGSGDYDFNVTLTQVQF